jgi:RNA polymerase sigma-70 factor, ECF subfamily
MTAKDANPLQGLEGSTAELDWNAVYGNQLPRIYNYFRFRVGPTHDVEELTARTFEKAWRARAQYRRDLAGFSTWLFAIARNVVKDHFRSEAHRIRAAALSDTSDSPSPEDRAMHSSDMARLLTLTAQLPERHKELIALKYGAALNNRMIARITGLSESNVGTILQRVVTSLRSQW